ncbi:glycosyltransferase family 2 protein [Clostridium carnis]
MENKKYGGVVVLYNPDNSVLKNIKTYIDELDILYVIDNSNNINTELIRCIKENKKCKYLSLDNNKGLAIALNIGCNNAINDNCDYILTVDQDSYFKENAVKKMKNFIENSNNEYAIVAPNVCLLYPENKSYTIIKDNKNKICNWVMTSGSIMKTENFKLTNKFDEKLFIEHIDIDIGMQFKNLGLKIIRLSDSIIYQRQGNSREKNFLMKKVHPLFDKPVRTYYLFRNHFYLINKYNKEYKNFSNVNLLYIVTKIFLYENKKIERFKMIYRGICDARKGKMGEYRN